MAEGLTYGIVPAVSRPALGVVSGMVGAGGNVGAVITNIAFFKGAGMRTDVGFVYMGFTIIGVTFTLLAMYFPESGGMLFPRGSLRWYDPQCIKPPADYRGADSMDYDRASLPHDSARVPTPQQGGEDRGGSPSNESVESCSESTECASDATVSSTSTAAPGLATRPAASTTTSYP